MSIARKALLIFVIPLLLQVVVLRLFLQSDRASNAHREWQTQSTRRVLATARLLGSMNDAQSAARAYALAGDAERLDEYRRALGSARAALRDLQQLHDAGGASAVVPAPLRFARIANVTSRAFDDLDLTRRLFEQHRDADAAVHLQSGGSLAAMDDFRRVGRAYQAEELRLQLEEQAEVEQLVARRRMQAMELVAANAVTGLALLWFLQLHVRGRLRLALQNMRRFAAGQPLVVPRERSDEIGQLDRQFHAMARQLETARESLHERNEELARMNEEKNRFLGMAAHDLRNPLFTVRISAEALLRREELSESSRTILRRVQATVRGMNKLVTDFLDVSRIEAGELLLRRDLHDVASVTRDAAEAVQYLAEQKQIDLQVRAGQPAIANVDAEKIGQVVTNFLTNAIKFSPPAAFVRVNVTPVEDRVRVSVQDGGPGIPAGDRERLFQPFSRLAARPTGGETSTGLGLAICRKIIEGHGGLITVESEEGNGATFAFELPLS